MVFIPLVSGAAFLRCLLLFFLRSIHFISFCTVCPTTALITLGWAFLLQTLSTHLYFEYTFSQPHFHNCVISQGESLSIVWVDIWQLSSLSKGKCSKLCKRNQTILKHSSKNINSNDTINQNWQIEVILNKDLIIEKNKSWTLEPSCTLLPAFQQVVVCNYVWENTGTF